jgi:hypothetical protein
VLLWTTPAVMAVTVYAPLPVYCSALVSITPLVYVRYWLGDASVGAALLPVTKQKENDTALYTGEGDDDDCLAAALPFAELLLLTCGRGDDVDEDAMAMLAQLKGPPSVRSALVLLG